jgi:hypothetical protein
MCVYVLRSAIRLAHCCTANRVLYQRASLLEGHRRRRERMVVVLEVRPVDLKQRRRRSHPSSCRCHKG